MIEVTNEAITQILKLQEEKQFDYIRLGVQPAGCAGFEYVFIDTSSLDVSDIVLNYGKFSFIVDQNSKEFIEGLTLDFVQEGLNKMFKFYNPKAIASCGCGESVTFNV